MSIHSPHGMDPLVNLFPYNEKGEARGERTGAIIQDNLSIHSKIISAISMSISYFSAKCDGYTPLSSKMFLDVRPFEARRVKTMLENTFRYNSYGALRQEIQWLSCGTLIILTYPDLRTRWGSLGFSSIHGAELNDREIILAPIGIRASLKWPKATNDLETSIGASHLVVDADGLKQDYKAATTAFLKQRGIIIKDDCQWLWLHVPLTNDGVAHIGTRDSHRLFQWPAHLCFYQRANSSHERDRTSWFWAGLSDVNADPLKEAETWFLQKDDRDRMVERQRQENAAEDKIRSRELQFKEDIFGSGTFPAMDRQIDTQGLSGIYPTPPDGFRSQGASQLPEQDILNANEQQEDVEMLDQTEQDKNIMKRDNISTDLLSNAGMSLGAYNDIEDDDLFGNMHSAMYTANGITEDDFSFFDEPKDPIIIPLDPSITALHGEEFLSSGPPQEKSSLSRHITEEDSEMLMDFESNDTERGIRSPALDARRLGTFSTSDAHAVQERSLLSTAMDGVDILPSADLDETMKSSKTIEIRKHTPESESRAQATPIQKNGFFVSMPLKTDLKAVDFKYADEGKFSVGKYEREGSLPSKLYNVTRSIPVLGIGTGHDSTSSSDRGVKWLLYYSLLLEADTYSTGDVSDLSSPSNSTSYSEPVADITTRSGTQHVTLQSESNLPQHRLGYSPDGNQQKSLTGANMTFASMLTPSDAAVSFVEDHTNAQQAFVALPNRLYTGQDAKFIQTAQLLADQLVVYSTPGKFDRSHADVESFTPSLTPYFDDPLSGILPAMFPQSEACTMEACASIGEALRGTASPPKAIIRPPPRKLEPLKAALDPTNASPFLFDADAPNMRVRRRDKVMELSAIGLQFWEELGLSPSLGPKDVTGFCIYPSTDMVHRGVESFMDVLSITYQSLKLGIHDWGYESGDEFPNGLVPFTLTHESLETTTAAIDASCERLGILHSRSSIVCV